VIGGQQLSHHSSTMSGYKWLKRGAVDPDGGFRWTRRPGQRTVPVAAPPTALHAYLLAGLPYEVDDELWEVTLQDVIGCETFPHQKTDGGPQQFEEDEQRHFALRGYLVRRIQSWTHEVAQEFARECELEVRGRALKALHDAVQVLEDGKAPHPGREREAIILGHEERLVSIWRAAREADGSPAQMASAYADAAAASRAAAAFTYASAVDSGKTDAATETAASAYADERRRQARWLKERLGLGESVARAVALDVA
jgi:hypothetical protein